MPNSYLITSLVTAGLALVLIIIKRIVFHFLIKRFEKRKRIFVTSFFESTSLPITCFLIFTAVAIIVPILLASFDKITAVYTTYAPKVRVVAILLLLLWGMLRYIKSVASAYEEKILAGTLNHDRTSVRAVAQILQLIAIIILSMIILQAIDIKITALLAFGGAGTLMVGLAAKDTLANVIGGMMLYWNRPFSVGDWVRSSERNIEGIVEDIGWRQTRIRTFEKRPLYVPNAVFSTISIENPSRMTNRRLKAVIGLRYDDASKIPAISKSIKMLLDAHEGIDTTLAVVVNFCEFADSSLNINLCAFTKTTNGLEFNDIQSDIFMKIIDIVAEHKAECAFPSRTLYIPDGLPT